MTGSPGDGADHRADDRANDRTDDRMADLEPAGHGDAGWLLIASLMSFAGFVVLTVALASRIVLPFDRPSLVPDRGWDGWPAVWRAIWGSANASLVIIGVGIGLALFWMNRRPEPVLVPRTLAAVAAARLAGMRLVARLQAHLRSTGLGPAGGLTILRSVARRAWHGSQPLSFVLGVLLIVAVDVLLVVAARIALDTHYPGDILAGIMGGTAALTLYTWLTSPGAQVQQPAAEMDTTELSEALEAEPVSDRG
jgi:hypothetical protein